VATLRAAAAIYANDTTQITSDLNSATNQSFNLAAAIVAGTQHPNAYTAIANSTLAAASELVILTDDDSRALMGSLSFVADLPFKIAIPNGNVLPAPTSGGTYFAAFSKTDIGKYFIGSTGDYFYSDGTGKQYFNKESGQHLSIGETITLTSRVQVVIRILGSVGFDGKSVVCFLGNAPVATPAGPKRIDSLKEGDLVLTETGKSVPIQRVKVMRVRPGSTTNPYVIRKGQFGATEELLISPRHCVAVGDKMIEARDLGLPQKTMKKPFTYYNIELPGWANMRVAGVEVESLAPAKRVVASLDQVKAAIAKLPKTTETLKIVQRICKRNIDGTFTVYGAMKG
jgi:hypothetical protein